MFDLDKLSDEELRFHVDGLQEYLEGISVTVGLVRIMLLQSPGPMTEAEKAVFYEHFDYDRHHGWHNIYCPEVPLQEILDKQLAAQEEGKVMLIEAMSHLRKRVEATADLTPVADEAAPVRTEEEALEA